MATLARWAQLRSDTSDLHLALACARLAADCEPAAARGTPVADLRPLPDPAATRGGVAAGRHCRHRRSKASRRSASGRGRARSSPTSSPDSPNSASSRSASTSFSRSRTECRQASPHRASATSTTTSATSCATCRAMTRSWRRRSAARAWWLVRWARRRSYRDQRPRHPYKPALPSAGQIPPRFS